MSPMTHESITETQKGSRGQKNTPRICSDAFPLTGCSQLRLGSISEALSVHTRGGPCRVKMKTHLNKIGIWRKSVIFLKCHTTKCYDRDGKL